MKRRTRSLAVILAVIMVVALFPMTVSAASKKPGKVKITKFKVDAVSTATNTTRVTLKWKKVKNAKGYEVFEFDNTSNQWVRIKKLGKRYVGLYIYNVSAGQRSYKVRAINKKKKGKFSKTKSMYIASPVSYERWVKMNGATTYNKSGALTYTVTGNEVLYSYDLKEMYPDATIYDVKDPTIINQLAATMDGNRSTFSELCRKARLEGGITGVSVRVVYLFDGETILGRTYTE